MPLVALNNASQTAFYGQVRCPGASSTTCFPTIPAISYNLALAALPKLLNVSLVFSLTLWIPFTRHVAVDIEKNDCQYSSHNFFHSTYSEFSSWDCLNFLSENFPKHF